MPSHDFLMHSRTAAEGVDELLSLPREAAGWDWMSFFVRRHGESNVPAEGWQRTDEVFVDPTTSRRMRVWVDPVDGARHYVADA